MSHQLNHDPRRCCRGKCRHATARNARVALAKTIDQTGDLTLVYYRCPHGAHYHVGHPLKSVQHRVRYRRLIALIERANAPVAKGGSPC